jgi:aspartate--ammonia ligase
LKRYNFGVGGGLYTDMNAIRREEELDNLHSIYVDQWDWEKVITAETRTVEYLKLIVTSIVNAICNTNDRLHVRFPQLRVDLDRNVTFVTTQELEDRYPDLTPKEREDAACKEYGAIFLMKIGGALRSGKKHDGRSPDYDDWELNGDIILWNDLLERSFEISSMGIRVDAEAMARQLELADCMDRAELPYQKAVLNDELPLTIGGGIGQSRLCMFFLRKAHIGEVQVSVWPEEQARHCEENNIHLL